MNTHPKDKDSAGQGGRIRRQPERASLSADVMKNLLKWMIVIAEQDETHRELKEEENKKR